jgi:hypothetical protein
MTFSLKSLGRLAGLGRRPAQAKRDLPAAQDVDFIPAADLRVEACPLCGKPSAGRLSVYPALDGRFRGRIVWWCESCGSGFVPNARALIADYYAAAYAAEIKQDRALSPEAYADPATRAASPAIARHLARVDQQIAALRRLGGAFDAVLDYGSGPGYFLRALDPTVKLAVEPDAASRPHLDAIGARVTTLDAVEPSSLDLIMASHALEHLCAEDLMATLRAMKAALKPDGLLYVEVPQGALSALRLAYRHEPHTIFFSPPGLEQAVRRAGLTIVERFYRSPGRGRRRANAMWAPDRQDPFQAEMGGGMTVVARRPPGRAAP